MPLIVRLEFYFYRPYIAHETFFLTLHKETSSRKAIIMKYSVYIEINRAENIQIFVKSSQ